MSNNIFHTPLMAIGLMVAALLVPQAVLAEVSVIIVFDVDRAIASSKAGKSMSAQLEKQIEVVRKKADSVREDLQGELDKLEEQKTLIAPDALKGKIDALRMKEIQKRQALASDMQAIQAGGEKAGLEIVKLAEKELSEIAKERKASIVLRRAAVFYASPAIDVTSELVARIDKKLTSVKVKPVKAVKKK